MARKKSRKAGKWLKGDILLVTLLKLTVVLALFFLSRICFYLFNLQYFSDLPAGDLGRILFFGLRFDLSAILIINLPFIFLNTVPFRVRYHMIYQGFANGYFYVINIIGLMANFIDLIYFRFTLKRTTGDIFNYLEVGGDFDKLVPQFIRDFWYVQLVWLLFCAALVFFASRFSAEEGAGKGKRKAFAYYSFQTLWFLIAGFVSIIGIRGGFQLRPIGIITAGNYTTAKNVPLILNTPFSIARTVKHESLKSVNYFRKEHDLSAIYNPVHKGMNSGFRDFNVMIIILESFSAEHIGALNRNMDQGKYEGFTPFMDSLIGQGLIFRAFANGKTSIQGIPSILSGIPSLMNESYIQSNYSTNRINSLAGLLKPKGYTTAFFHGGTNGTMGFDSYTRYAGFDHYYGRSEYHNEKDYDGKWGIRDEEFFQYTATVVSTLPRPFLAALFSLSSHHPYYVPEKFSRIFPKGHLQIQQSIMYTDYSLRRFFETARKMPWFGNTLFVITADHTSEGYSPYYQTTLGQYALPILFYFAGSALRGSPPDVAQQTDILPSVLGYLGYDRDFVAFGNNLFDPSAPRFSIHYISGLYGLVRDGYFLQFDGTRTVAFYDLRSDSLQLRNLAGTGLPGQKEMEIFIKAFIQQYNNRVIENRLTAD